MEEAATTHHRDRHRSKGTWRTPLTLPQLRTEDFGHGLTRMTPGRRVSAPTIRAQQAQRGGRLASWGPRTASASRACASRPTSLGYSPAHGGIPSRSWRASRPPRGSRRRSGDLREASHDATSLLGLLAATRIRAGREHILLSQSRHAWRRGARPGPRCAIQQIQHRRRYGVMERIILPHKERFAQTCA